MESHRQGQLYNIGEKPTVTLYTYINHHVGTFFPPDWGMVRRSRCIQIFL